MTRLAATLLLLLAAACHEPAPRPEAPATSSAASTAAAPAPAGCSTDADCPDGVCEGEGCAPGQGHCAPKDRVCTRDLVTYCGCDGVTFRASGSCPGRRYASKGACPGDAQP